MTERVPSSRPGAELFFTSAALLFAELLLIRWIPSQIAYVGFFSNFLLIGCFVGMGAGVLVGRSERRPPRWTFAALLLAVVIFVTRFRFFLAIGAPEEIFFSLPSSAVLGTNLVLPLVVLLTLLVMAALAMPLGRLLPAMPPLRAYAIDVAGALVGIALFTGSSALGAPPIAWFAVLSGLVYASAASRGIIDRSSLASAALLAATMAAVFFTPSAGPVEGWSPYYRVTAYPISNNGAFAINVNGMPHQTFGPLPEVMPRNPPYEQVYRWFPGRTFPRTLIIGSGGGNDVAIALRRGATEIDAVEIDPFIARIGRERHPHQPYSDSRVRLTIDDGRAFLKRTTRKYDLILFAAPDSFTVATATNVRMESFLFTREAFDEARDALAPGGIVVLNNLYWRPWLVERLAGMLEASFGAPPLVRHDDRGNHLAVLAAGPLVASLGAGLPPADASDARRPTTTAETPCASTDDWPFPYLRTPGLPLHYVAALAVALGMSIVVVLGASRVAGARASGFSPHFFFLGVAFLLLETRSLVTFSLLFGLTWLVNSLAFFAILMSVLAAIGLAAAIPLPPRPWLYAALFASLGVGYFVPPERLLVDPPALRYALAAAIAFAPIFIANLVFTRSFRDTRSADTAFASNLIGAAFGGALEYLSLAIGFRALLLVSAALYALALAFDRWRILGDRAEPMTPPAP